jgi:xylulokinase
VKDPVALAWDLGTSGAKAALVTLQGDVLGSEFVPTKTLLLPDGGAEQDTEEWWSALLTATDRLFARELCPRDRVVVMGVTAQWSGTVAVAANGKPLMNAVIWMDSRGVRRVRELTGGAIALAGYSPLKLLQWVRLTGGAPARSGKDSLSHVLFLKSERPRIYEQTHRFLEPKDYLTYRLTGRLTASFDSITLHWVTDNRDSRAVKYDTSLLELAGLERSKLPDLVPSTELLGPLLPELRQRFGLSPSVEVASGAPDLHSAAIGAGTTKDFATHLYVGTSSWIACHVAEKKTDVKHNMAALPAAIPGRYLLMNEQESAGACLTQVRDKLFFPNDDLGSGPPPNDFFKRFDRVAAHARPGSSGLLFFPWLYGERTPVEDPALRGGFLNYSLSHERSDVLRSVLEGVAYNSRWLFGCVEEFAGRRIEELRFIGGGAESELWTQIFADVLDRPLLRVKDPMMSNLRGAALIALVGKKELSFDDVEGRVAVTERVKPRRENRAVYDRLFSEFMAFHASARPIFERLNAKAKST